MNTEFLNESYADPQAGHISSYFCQLFILLTPNSLQYCILDTEGNKFIALANYKLADSTIGSEKYNEQVAAIISRDQSLQKKYPSVVAGIDSTFHTLVPESLYDAAKVPEYLGFNFRMPEGHYYFSDCIDEISAYNAAAIPGPSKELILNSFNKVAIVHSSTAVLKASYHLQQNDPHSSQLFLNIRNRFIDMVLYEEGKILLFNSFQYASKEDILFYTLYVMEQFSLQPGKVHLCLGGIAEESSEVYQLLAKYVEHLAFAGRLKAFDYSTVFAQLSSQRYLDLFALALCGS